ncbi:MULTISPECIES: ATP-dependent nuclease [unclassified Bradyrhizobium]|uniref:ATP-dependent nuclease n=1 Tax=unclassified Bradyrhizobium TaxID=2631580 RepID=UPI0028E60492|nr:MULTISPECIES: AAA family ATPase [unclassified Bradyrhizobium]
MKYLSQLSIQFFRGILAEQTIFLGKPTGTPGSGLTILVGPNNAGKSTIVEALRLVVAPGDLLDKGERHRDYPLRISIRDTANGYREITNPGLGARLVATGTAHPSFNTFRFIPSRRPWAHRTGGHLMLSGDYWTQRTSYSRQEDLGLVSRLNSLPPEEKVAFQRELQELVPQLSNWRIEYYDGSTYLEYSTYNGTTHAANLLGDGVASLFRIVLGLYDPEESFVVIDEPELSLHPQAQKRLARYLSSKAQDRQIVICTHCPHFINWNDLSAGATIYRLNQRADGINVHRLTDRTLSFLRKLKDDWQKPQLLDAVSKEIFFTDEVLEGQEDVGLIARFMEVEHLPPIQLFGYGAGGSKNILAFLAMASDLDIRNAAIFDGTSEDEFELAKATFADANLTLLPTADIRDKPERQLQGLFDQKGIIKPQFRETLKDILLKIRTHFDCSL